MNQGLLRKIAAAGLAMLMLVTLASSIGQAVPGYCTINYITNRTNDNGDRILVIDIILTGTPYTVRSADYINGYYYVCGEALARGYKVRNSIQAIPEYIFTGWNTERDGSGTPITPGDTIIVNTDLTLYPEWTPNPQSTPTPEPTLEPTLEPTPEPTPSPIPTPKPKTVTFTYKSNYAGGQTNVTDKPIKGSSYTVRNNPFTREGYTFTGWNTKAKGTGVAVNEGKVLTANGNATLYAQWTEDSQSTTVTFTYKANAGDSQADEIDTVNINSAYAFKSNPFTRSGYKFNDWNSKPDGTGIAIKAGLKVTANETSITIKKAQFLPENGIYTLYAQWK